MTTPNYPTHGSPIDLVACAAIRTIWDEVMNAGGGKQIPFPSNTTETEWKFYKRLLMHNFPQTTQPAEPYIPPNDNLPNSFVRQLLKSIADLTETNSEIRAELDAQAQIITAQNGIMNTLGTRISKLEQIDGNVREQLKEMARELQSEREFPRS